MSSRHALTWLRWIEQLTVMRESQTIRGDQERRAMAEALSLAAPDGPKGFAHGVDCDCAKRARIEKIREEEGDGPLFPRPRSKSS